jgi:hypothetical protein
LNNEKITQRFSRVSRPSEFASPVKPSDSNEGEVDQFERHPAERPSNPLYRFVLLTGAPIDSLEEIVCTIKAAGAGNPTPL